MNKKKTKYLRKKAEKNEKRANNQWQREIHKGIMAIVTKAS